MKFAPLSFFLQVSRWFSFLTFLLLLGVSNAHSYLAVIDNKSVSLQEYQKYIDVKKFISQTQTLDELARLEQKSKSDLFNEFIDQKIILIEANKKGFNLKNKYVSRKYRSTKDQWLYGLYASLNKKDQNASLDEAFVTKFYRSLPQSKQKKYADLRAGEKQQIIQYAILQKKKDTDTVLRKKLEKKYRVKRYGLSKKIVASVEKTKITRTETDKLFLDQLREAGIDPQMFEEKDPSNYKKARAALLDGIIFQKLLDLDMGKKGFRKKKLTLLSLEFYQKKIILNEFVVREVAKNTPVSDNEMDQAFKILTKSNPQIQQMLPSEQEKILRNAIIQQKLPEILSRYLISRKEEIIVKKNRKQLNQIK